MKTLLKLLAAAAFLAGAAALVYALLCPREAEPAAREYIPLEMD